MQYIVSNITRVPDKEYLKREKKQYEDYKKWKKSQKPKHRKRKSFSKYNAKKFRKAKIFSYKQYIKSGIWTERKANFYKKHKKMCAACFSTKSLNLHHVNYSRLGSELDTDLVVLCKDCHAEYHELHGVEKESLRSTSLFIIQKQQSEELRILAKNL